MIQIIEAKIMGMMGIPPRKYVIDTSIKPQRGYPIIHRFKNEIDFEWAGYRFVEHWDGQPTNNSIQSVIIILK